MARSMTWMALVLPEPVAPKRWRCVRNRSGGENDRFARFLIDADANGDHDDKNLRIGLFFLNIDVGDKRLFCIRVVRKPGHLFPLFLEKGGEFFQRAEFLLLAGLVLGDPLVDQGDERPRSFLDNLRRSRVGHVVVEVLLETFSGKPLGQSGAVAIVEHEAAHAGVVAAAARPRLSG